MAVETDDDRTILLADFGVTATYTPDGGSAVSITGIRDDIYQEVELGIAGVAASEPRFLAKTTDVASAAEGDTLTIGSDSYIIRVVMNDGTGMTELVLEEQ